jgi:hypothetical protein
MEQLSVMEGSVLVLEALLDYLQKLLGFVVSKK